MTKKRGRAPMGLDDIVIGSGLPAAGAYGWDHSPRFSAGEEERLYRDATTTLEARFQTINTLMLMTALGAIERVRGLTRRRSGSASPGSSLPRRSCSGEARRTIHPSAFACLVAGKMTDMERVHAARAAFAELGEKHPDERLFVFCLDASLIPCFRHSSAVFTPASCSRRTPMI